MLPEPNNFFRLRRNSWRQAVVRHLELCYPLLSSYSSCFMFRKHPVQLKTATTNDMFSKYVHFKKGHLNKRAGVWTPWTPPGPATELFARRQIVQTVQDSRRLSPDCRRDSVHAARRDDTANRQAVVYRYTHTHTAGRHSNHVTAPRDRIT